MWVSAYDANVNYMNGPLLESGRRGTVSILLSLAWEEQVIRTVQIGETFPEGHQICVKMPDVKAYKGVTKGQSI